MTVHSNSLTFLINRAFFLLKMTVHSNSFHVDAWDKNCPQHIPQRFDREHVDELLLQRDLRIEELEKEVSLLKAKNR